MVEALLTPHEVAALLKVEPSTIWEWCRKGRMRHLKIGRVMRIKPAWVNEFVGSYTKG